MNVSVENKRIWRFAVVGLGNRSLSCYVPILLGKITWKLVSVCDINQSSIKDFSEKYCTADNKINVYESYHDLIKELVLYPIDLVIISVYHNAYLEIVKEFLSRKINVLKEKPFACSLQSTICLERIIRNDPTVRFSCGVQRRFNPFYYKCKEEIGCIGNIKYVRVSKDIAKVMLNGDWRRSKSLCGGGALIDTGYHVIDLLIFFFGYPSKFREPNFIYENGYYPMHSDEVEETFHVKLSWKSSDKNFDSFVNISRCGFIKEDCIFINGTQGSIYISDKCARVFLKDKDFVKIIKNEMSEKDVIHNMISKFIDETSSSKTKIDTPSIFDEYLNRDLEISKLIFEMYGERFNLQAAFTWPRITAYTTERVIDQLKNNISIYDRSGIIKEFEENFLEFINFKNSFAVLFNSGTMAISALYKGICLMPNDYVIVPVYTFHATVSPIMHYGAIPIFCDCDKNGNMDPKALEDKINNCIMLGIKVKAIMVTHMWGQPAQIIEITKICKSKNIILLEDCSHSHGALVNGEAIGTFGVAAAWSIQGQKIISGGEGGILVTNDKEIYSQALIYGHYNKRCQQELSKDCSLYKYSITGSGFKLRSHPLAVAIANEQLALAPSFIKIKRQFATLLIEELKSIPFLEMPSIQQNVKPSWYAFIMKFKRNNKFTREKFYQALKEAGLNEIDIPQSTKLLNGEALFNEPHHVLPHLYGEPIEENIKSYQKKYDLLNSFEFASAQEFYETALKLPVWAYKDEEKIVQHYIKTIKNVAKTFLDLY